MQGLTQQVIGREAYAVMMIFVYRSTIVVAIAISLACLTLSTRIALAQAAGGEINVEQILRELELIQKGRANDFKSGLQRSIDSLSSAAASKQAASDLYEDAVLAVDFDGKPKDGAEFAAWREKNKEMLLDGDFREGLRLHLQYLVLSLKRVNGQTVEQLLPELMDYVSRVATINSEWLKREKQKNDVQERNEKNRPKDRQTGQLNKDVVKAGRDLLNKPISGSPFVRWYRLEGYVSGLREWEPASGNVEGIVDKTLMPYMREKKDPRLIELWDARIARMDEESRKSGLAIDEDKYQNQTLPTLMWSRAQDRMVLGQRSQAVGEMFHVIKTYKAHADFDKWVKDLVALLKSDSTATAAKN